MSGYLWSRSASGVASGDLQVAPTPFGTSNVCRSLLGLRGANEVVHVLDGMVSHERLETFENI